MSTTQGGYSIIQDGLAFYVDIANPRSYVSGSTVCHDLTKQRYTGVLTPSNVITYQSANLGALNFDGTTSRVLFDEIDFGSVWTFSVWFLRNAGTISAVLVGVAPTSYIFYIDPNQLLYVRFSDGNYIQCPVVVNFSADVWYNLTLVRNGSDLTWYINGEFLTNTTGATAINKITSIGSSGDPTGGLNGKISSVIGYKRVLSASEIFQNYNALKYRFSY